MALEPPFDFAAHIAKLTQDAIPRCAYCDSPGRCDCGASLIYRADATPEKPDMMIAPDVPFEVFTDGSGNTGDRPCGCGIVIVRYGVVIAEASVGFALGTNNFAEVSAIGLGLRLLGQIVHTLVPNPDCRNLRFAAIVKSDSEFALKSTAPDSTWKLRPAADGSVKPTTTVVHRVRELRSKLPRVRFEWIEGHAGHQYNERADELAGLARKRVIASNSSKKTEK